MSDSHIHYNARKLQFPLHEYDRETLAYAMGRGEQEFTANEMNAVLGRVRHTKSKGGDFRSYASLRRLVNAGFLSRSSKGRGCVSYCFNRHKMLEFVANIRLSEGDMQRWLDAVAADRQFAM